MAFLPQISSSENTSEERIADVTYLPYFAVSTDSLPVKMMGCLLADLLSLATVILGPYILCPIVSWLILQLEH